MHVLEEEVVLVLGGQVACMLDKYLVKRYAISLILHNMYNVKMQGWFWQWYFLNLQRWYLDLWIVSRTPNINSFFFDFLQRKLNDQLKLIKKIYIYLSLTHIGRKESKVEGGKERSKNICEINSSWREKKVLSTISNQVA